MTRKTFLSNQNVNLETDLKRSFKEECYEPFKQQILFLFIQNVNLERDGKIVETQLFKEVINFSLTIENSAINFNCLNKHPFIEIEVLLIESTIEYYKQKVIDKLSNLTQFEYLNWALKEINEETQRIERYLPEESVQTIIEKLNEILLFEFREELLLKGNCFIEALKEEEKENKNEIVSLSSSSFVVIGENNNKLKLLYDKFSKDEKSFNLMLKIFKNHLNSEFSQILTKTENLINSNSADSSTIEIAQKTNFIDDFINFYLKYTQIIENSLSNQNLFKVYLREALLENNNNSNNKFNISYILPFYLDKHLRKTKNNSMIESAQIIKKTLLIFSAIPDKDVFIEIHRNLVIFLYNL